MKTGMLVALTMTGAMLSGHAYAQTSTWKIDPAHSSANFEITHMAVSHVHGSFSNVNGTVILNDQDIAKSSVQATIDTTTVSTGVAQRDTHLKSEDFFNVQKYPDMIFKSTGLTRAGGRLQLIGDLTLDGVTKPVTLDVEGPAPPQVMMGKTISGFSATGVIHRSDFNFGNPKFNAMIGNDVKLTIDVEIDKQ